MFINEKTKRKRNEKKMSSFLYPLETNHQDLSLDLEFYNRIDDDLFSITTEKPKKYGITFLIRAKNESTNIDRCIQSLFGTIEEKFSYNIVFVDNGSDDDTFEKAERLLLDEKHILKKYPVQLAKAGLEAHVTPSNSVHSLPWFYQWCLQQCGQYTHVFKWDADFEMTGELATFLECEFSKPIETETGPGDQYQIPAIDHHGISNQEPYLFSLRAHPYYVRYWMWEVVRFAFPLQNTHTLGDGLGFRHHSSLQEHKSYLSLSPWWTNIDDNNNNNNKNVATNAKIQYEKIAQSLPEGTQLYCRASDPACDPVCLACPQSVDLIQGLDPKGQGFNFVKEEEKEKKKKRRTFRFHVLGIIHLPCAERYNSCAFTQKVHKLCKMLLDHGHTVFLYASEGSDALCSELVQTHTIKEIADTFGDGNTEFELGYDYHKSCFHDDFGNPNALTHQVRQRVIDELERRAKPDDFLLLSMGLYHKPIANASKLYLQCEPGIGYRGSYARFRAFESSSIQYFTYGSQNPFQSINGSHYDRIIPNYFRLTDFPFLLKPKGDENGNPYYVFLGRIITRKGLQFAYQTCEHLGVRLKIAGQGYRSYNEETRVLVDCDGRCYTLTDEIEFVGFADAAKRATLLGNAVGCFAPSVYLEPFCGVNVEAQLCGTPVLTTDFGAFIETVEHGKTGFRCHTLNDFILGAQKVFTLDRSYIRERAERLYSCEAVNQQFEKWWQDLYDVYESTVDSYGKEGFNRIRTKEEQERTLVVQTK